jgi:gluconate 2-dehydrogenase subunit 3-like protein
MGKTCDINRRGALQVLAGTVVGTVNFPGSLAGQQHLKFFHRDEFEMLDVLSEIIIPADNHSPGAHAAQVAQFMDELISQSPEKTKKRWREGLARIEAMAGAQYSRRFMACSAAEQTALMRLISQNEESPQQLEERFFTELKQATIDGYYRSAIGIHQDLRYQGNKYVGAFPECNDSKLTQPI